MVDLLEIWIENCGNIELKGGAYLVLIRSTFNSYFNLFISCSSRGVTNLVESSELQIQSCGIRESSKVELISY